MFIMLSFYNKKLSDIGGGVQAKQSPYCWNSADIEKRITSAFELTQ